MLRVGVLSDWINKFERSFHFGQRFLEHRLPSEMFSLFSHLGLLLQIKTHLLQNCQQLEAELLHFLLQEFVVCEQEHPRPYASYHNDGVGLQLGTISAVLLDNLHRVLNLLF